MLMLQICASRFRDSLQDDVFRIGAYLVFICVSNNLFVLSETEHELVIETLENGACTEVSSLTVRVTIYPFLPDGAGY